MNHMKLAVTISTLILFNTITVLSKAEEFKAVEVFPPLSLKLNQARKDLLSKLRKLNGEYFHFDFHADGSLSFLAGKDISPDCRLPDGAGPAEAEQLVKCFISSVQPLLSVDDENPAKTDIRVSEPHVARDGMTFVRAQQYYENIPVRHGLIKLVLAHGKIFQFSGRLFRPGLLQPKDPTRSLPTFEEAKSQAEKLTKRQLELFKRYFDTELSTVISEFADKNRPEIRIIFDEFQMNIIKTLNVADHVNLVTKRTNKMDYPDGFRQGGTSEDDIDIDLQSYYGLCRGYLDHGSDNDDGEPKVGYKSGGEYVPDGSKTYYEYTSCSPNTIIMYHLSDDETEFKIMNAYYWMHDLSVFANHWRAEYDSQYEWDDYESENLHVMVKKRGPHAVASSGITEYTIKLPINATEPGYSDDSPLDLETMAHEYGHFIHFMYDSSIPYDYEDGSGNFFGQSVEEGFAQHNVLRYAMFRWRENANRPHDSYPVLQYDGHPLGVPDYSHESEVSNGQHILKGSGIGDALIFYRNSSACSGSDPDPHDCGDVLPAVYWELVWNECQVSYRSCEEGQRILDTYSYIPEAFANNAYTFAIISMDDDDGVKDFFNYVSSAYNWFKNEGFITEAEYWRVHAVLNHHCVGWSNHCDDYYKLPWSKLPAALTKKAKFADHCDTTRCEELIFYLDMYLAAGVPTTPFGTADDARYIHLDSPGEYVWKDVYFPSNSFYSFHGAVRAQGTCCDSFWVQIDDGEDHYWDIEDDYFNSWSWSHSGPVINISQGWHEVKIKFREPTSIVAFLIRRENDTDGDGIIDREDNCKNDVNPDQENMDGDYWGDACDGDKDGDEVECVPGPMGFPVCGTGPTFPVDNCPDVANQDQSDLDGDGVGDACDPDIDGDGVPNEEDDCPFSVLCFHYETLYPDWLEFAHYLAMCFERPEDPQLLGSTATRLEKCIPPIGCPDCLPGISESWILEKIPSYFQDLYTYVLELIEPSAITRFSEEFINVIEKSFANAPIGENYTNRLQATVLNKVREFKRTKQVTPSLKSALIEAVNAIELDLRVPPLSPIRVEPRKRSAVDFQGVAWLVFKNLEKPGEISLRVSSGLPAIPRRFEPGWPIARYSFDFRGELSKATYVDISFYFGGIGFSSHASTLRILEWDGKAFRDITTALDVNRMIITGRTNRLSTYVIMSVQK